MMADPFDGVLPFVATAEERGFSRAARRLGVTTAAVSKAIAKLETELGVRLLNRSSRHVALTPEGSAYLERCRAALLEMRAGREQLARARAVVEGTLTVSLSIILGRPIVRALPELGARWPNLTVRLSLTDRIARLLEEEVDVAVRIGALADSSLRAKKLRTPRWVLAASPSYLARRGAPRSPDALAEHDAILFVAPSGTIVPWTLRTTRHGRPRTIQAKPALLIDNGELLIEAAAAGLGLCQTLDFLVESQLREGRLVEVLPEHATAGPPIHAVSLPGRDKTPKVRVFLDFLQDVLGAR
jgi:DNA-binding transcriptional LysR family regulator